MNAEDLLSKGLNDYYLRLNKELLSNLAVNFRARPDHARELQQHQNEEYLLAHRMIEFLKYTIKQDLDLLRNLGIRHEEFVRHHPPMSTDAANQLSIPREKKQHILDYARELGATERQLRGDDQSFKTMVWT